MAEPLRHSYDEEVKPESAPMEQKPLPPALPGTPPAEFHEEPFLLEDERTSAAQQLGSAMGGALGNLSSRVRSGLRVVAGRSKDAGDALGEMTDTAQERAKELSQQAGIRMDEFRRTAYQRIRSARVALRRTIDERPLESILAIGGMALVIGFVLRVWRSNRD
jgi:ElaB/YqjD/DUF883 family membrane-anchored ribosome-binding protein